MARVPWTKFQDFYLRLGFLKVLVAVLSPQRRSALNDAIVRRLETPLFDAAPAHRQLWDAVKDRVSWYEKRTAVGKSIEVDEALLVYGETESLLYGITRDTAYKILDWGRDVDFVGRGNQITERGLMLRHLLPEQALTAFLAGDVLAWNPFVLTLEERLFFLYHLVEIDRVTVEIIAMLADVEPGVVLESGDAARITCRALFRVLDAAQDTIDPRHIPEYRVARELACVIADELSLEEFQKGCEGQLRRRVPKPVKPTARANALLSGGSKKPRKTTKNADHQTIPRFEQLVDLGFLAKVSEDAEGAESSLVEGKRRWRYRPTTACRQWADAMREASLAQSGFQWHSFARTAVSAFRGGQSKDGSRRPPDAGVLADYLWEAYRRVGRSVGNSPLDSVALQAMITAAAAGVVLEMVDFHALMLAIKRRSALPAHAFFASGNDLDKMFIQLKPGFPEQVRAIPDLLTPASET